MLKANLEIKRHLIIIACFQSIERDPNINLPPPVLGGFSPTIIGEQPPDFVGMDDICPPVQNAMQDVLSHYELPNLYF